MGQPIPFLFDYSLNFILRRVDMIYHSQYDKLTDDLLYLGSNMILRFNVSLSNKSDKFGRNHYHKEFSYYNKDSRQNFITLRRSFDYYLSIESVRVDEENPIKIFMQIGIYNILYVRQFLNDIEKWYSDPKYFNLYGSKNGDLVLTKVPSRIGIDLPPQGNYLLAEPMVYIDKFNNTDIGLRLYISSETRYVEMPLDKFRAMNYLIQTIDMYTSACLLINYLERPEYGTNLTNYAMYGDDNPEDQIPNQPNTNGRKIQSKNNKQSLEDI